MNHVMYNQIFHTYRHDAREQEIRQGHKGLRPIDENLSYTRETSTRVGRRNEERKRVHHIQWWEGEYTKKLHGARFRYLLNDFFWRMCWYFLYASRARSPR